MAAKSTDQVRTIVEQKCENSNYCKHFINDLNKMRIDRKLFDFCLNVDGEFIYVHKIALAIASPYFAAMFESESIKEHAKEYFITFIDDVQETSDGFLKLDDAGIIAVKVLVDYVYSGIIMVTEENVESLLSVSNLFQFTWVKEQCEKFLKNNMNSRNCFRIRKFADMHSLKDLYDYSHKYILINFDNLMNEEELLLLPFEQISELIKDDQLSVKSEDNVYEVVINWLKYDLEKRKIHLAELMGYIRFPLLSGWLLRNRVATETLLKENLTCNQFLIEALTYQLTPIHERECLLDDFRFKNRAKYRSGTLYVFLVGGSSRLVHGMCKVYDVSKSKLTSVSYMNEPRWNNSVISLNTTIYSVGGKCGKSLSTAEYYDLANKKWNYIAPMNNARVDFGICAYNDSIYVVGGEGTMSAERYSPETNKWYLCPDMPEPSDWGTRAALIESRIYSLSHRSDGFTSCVCFDPREKEWNNLNGRAGGPEERFELFPYNGSLFCLTSKDFKRLDIRANKWELMPFMRYERVGFSAALTGGVIYVLGGKNDSEFIKNVECYNFFNNEWTTVDSVKIDSHFGGATAFRGFFNCN